eukprot:g6314.t1
MMSSSTAAAAHTNLFELSLDDEQDVAGVEATSPCATPRGYRAIPVDLKPTTWQADLSKCSVCEARFTWLNHRHKCRKCMEAVCNSCSKERKVLRAFTAPKRVCDNCTKSCWMPRNTATTPRKKSTAADTPGNKPVGKDDCRFSLTVSTSDANACPVVATSTAPLSPGTPAAAGFFGPGCVTPSATTASAPTAANGVAGDIDMNITTTSVDTRPSSSCSHRRSHRRQVSVAMPSLPLASPAVSASSSASPPPTTTMMMLPPPTPAAAIGEEDEDEAEAEAEEAVPPPSGAASPSSSTPAPPALFFGGRPGAVRRGRRRESSGGRLESRVWGGGRALGGGADGGDVERAIAELLQLREETVTAKMEGEEGRQVAAAALPALPEEPVDAAPAAAAAADAVEEEEEEVEGECDYGEGGPMMMKITACSGAAFGGVAVGTGVVVAVLLRFAVSLVL